MYMKVAATELFPISTFFRKNPVMIGSVEIPLHGLTPHNKPSAAGQVKKLLSLESKISVSDIKTFLELSWESFQNTI